MYEVIRFPLTEKMTTGVEKVDSQHRQLLDLAANLVNSMGERLSDEKVMEDLDFLSNYVVIHFRDEEQLQVEAGYPDYLEHKTLHDGFVEVLWHLRDMYGRVGNSESFQHELNESVIAWVIDHICAEDQKFVMYYKLNRQDSAGIAPSKKGDEAEWK